MFLNNKYTRLYFKIINSSTDDNQYTENHHIIPKCLGGTNNKSNLTSLSARKHFICHYLLTKMVSKSSKYFYKLINAFCIMKANIIKRYINSRLYESQRVNFSKLHSIRQSGTNNSNYNKTWVYCPYTFISKMINKNDLQYYIELGCVKGRIINIQEFLSKFVHMRKIKNKRISYPCQHCGKLSYNKKYCSNKCAAVYHIPPNTTGLIHTIEAKQKMSEKAKNRPKVKCIYCDAYQSSNTINRYHNENCKFKMIDSKDNDSL